MSNQQLVLSARQCEANPYCNKETAICGQNCEKDCFITEILIGTVYNTKIKSNFFGPAQVSLLKEAAKDYLDNLEA